MCVPLEVELKVAQDSAAGQEGAAHAGEQVPVGAIGRSVWVWHVIGLLDELAVDLVAQGSKVVAGLQDALDDGSGVGHSLHLLQRVKDLHCLILKAGVTLLLLDCTGGREREREREK